jgi:hypothetical protein
MSLGEWANLIGDGASTERLKTGAVYSRKVARLGRAEFFAPPNQGLRFAPSPIRYWLLAIGYSQRASGELPLRAE